MNEQNQVNKPEKDNTNWKAWYIGVLVFLIVQIILYIIITNQFAK